VSGICCHCCPLLDDVVRCLGHSDGKEGAEHAQMPKNHSTIIPDKLELICWPPSRSLSGKVGVAPPVVEDLLPTPVLTPTAEVALSAASLRILHSPKSAKSANFTSPSSVKSTDYVGHNEECGWLGA
jgi:hypothetical protein